MGYDVSDYENVRYCMKVPGSKDINREGVGISLIRNEKKIIRKKENLNKLLLYEKIRI